MAATGVSSVKPKNQPGFLTLLSSAACEWFLIFMLCVDGALSYLLTKFARYCNLQAPCPLCSRIDHVFEKKKSGYYRSLFCSNHIEEISSLVCCHNHGKLADVHAICEDCIMSLVRSRKYTSESYRLLVGKLGLDIEESGFKILLLSKSFLPNSSGPRACSCCNRILRAKSNDQRLLRVTPVGFGASKANVKPPLPRVPGCSRFSHRESLKRLRDKFSGPLTPRSAGVDPLSHVGYTELKITSDSESEFPFSDDEDATSAFYGKNDHKLESYVKQGSPKLPDVDTDESRLGNHQASEPMPSLLDQPTQLESSEQNSENSLVPNAFAQHGLEELNWTGPNSEPNSYPLPELISLDDTSQSGENSKSNASILQVSNLSVLSELIPLNNLHSPSNAMKNSEQSSDVITTHDTENILVAKHATGTRFSNDKSSSMPNNINPINTWASSNKERRAFSVLAEPLTTTDSAENEEDCKALPQVSYPDVDPSTKDTSPKVHCDSIDMIQMAAALERHDSGHESVYGISINEIDGGHESLDGISVNEIDGETDLDRLKRQVEYDRRCMKALSKELEEERSAASVAANEAMSMITRLQEEKASLHMEALQYLRMMEEQAEYDMEALEKANDLLAEKEKQIQELEVELEIYGNNLIDEHKADGLHKATNSSKGDSIVNDKYQVTRVEISPSATDDSKSTSISKGSKSQLVSTLAFNLDDEKLYISKCLKTLEMKFQQVSRYGEVMNLSNGEYSEKETNGVDNQDELPTDRGTQINHQKGENGMSMQTDLSASNGRPTKQKSADVVEENHLAHEEIDHLDLDQKKMSAHAGEIKLDTFRNEILDLRDRLEALETDGDILKHALNSLQNGNDGLLFIQEIAHQLQELRKIKFKKRGLSIP